MAPSTSTTECSHCPDPGVVWIDGRLLCGACALRAYLSDKVMDVGLWMVFTYDLEREEPEEWKVSA